MNKVLKHCLTAWLGALVIAGLLSGPALAAGISITFAPRAKVSGDTIRIKDLATSITGRPQEMIDRLRETVVGPAPAPGKTKRISSRRINDLLSFDKLGLDRLQARIPPLILVERGSTTVTRAMMDQAFREAVQDNLPFVPDHIEITDVKTPKDQILPSGDLEIVPRFSGASRMPGRVTVNLDFMIDGALVESKRVAGMVRFFQRTVVSARPLPRGKIISERDLTVIRRQIRSTENMYFEDPKQVVGLMAKRSILSGQPIKPAYVARPILVKRGDRVTLLAQKGRLSITANGVIRDQKGSLGDQVKVLNLTTKREVYGELVNSNTVKVTF